MSWHAADDLLVRYADGSLPDAASWSVETHVSGCSACRDRLPRAAAATDIEAWVGEDRLAAVWLDVSDRVRATRRPLIERLLLRLRMPDSDARLLAATPSLMTSWLLGVAVVLGMSVTMAWLAAPDSERWLAGFLLVAPLVPVAGVAVAFGPRVDPTYDLAVVAPMRSSRLLLLRSVAVLATSLGLAAVAALALPAAGWLAAAWILPSLALTMMVLAASTRWHPWAVSAVVATAWVAAVVALEVQMAAPLTAFGPRGQLAMACLLAASTLTFSAFRERVDPAVRA